MSEAGGTNEQSQAEITKIKQGFFRKIGRLGLPEYHVPDILNQKVEQPLGVNIFLQGPKDNLRVLAQAPTGNISFADISPEGTTFEINNDDVADWKANRALKKVIIPSNLSELKEDTAFSIIHEISHLWAEKDRGQSSGITMTGDRKGWEDPLMIIEAKTYAITLYILGKLRRSGVDFIPQYDIENELLQMNEDADEEVEERNSLLAKINTSYVLRFTADEFKSLFSGDLPLPGLKEEIDVKIEQSLTKSKNTGK